MNIVDDTFFTGKINLPQVGNSDGLANVTQFIDTYEPEYLKKVLGYDLWKAFTEGIEGSGTPDQRWLDLLQGKEFQYQSKPYNWAGFENKPSPISQYVYYQVLEDSASDTVLVGQSTGKTENAIRTSPVSKMIAAWNEMVELNIMLWNFLYVNKATYPEWDVSYPYWYWPYYGGIIHQNEIFNLKNSLDL